MLALRVFFLLSIFSVGSSYGACSFNLSNDYRHKIESFQRYVWKSPTPINTISYKLVIRDEDYKSIWIYIAHDRNKNLEPKDAALLERLSQAENGIFNLGDITISSNQVCDQISKVFADKRGGLRYETPTFDISNVESLRRRIKDTSKNSARVLLFVRNLEGKERQIPLQNIIIPKRVKFIERDQKEWNESRQELQISKNNIQPTEFEFSDSYSNIGFSWRIKEGELSPQNMINIIKKSCPEKCQENNPVVTEAIEELGLQLDKPINWGASYEKSGAIVVSIIDRRTFEWKFKSSKNEESLRVVLKFKKRWAIK